MKQSVIEEKRNQLNLNIRSLLEVIKFIDGINEKYPDYVTNSMDEESFLDQQNEIVNDAKERLINVFRD